MSWKPPSKRAFPRSSRHRPRRCLGLPTAFPTTELHHPYNNRTIYGACKSFNEGLLRSFAEMYGLRYVALRYFNVYGPRMDTHGAYTEVLIRWMERLASGLAPVIHGDGTQTMDFVDVRDIARANMLAAKSDVTDEVFNVASGRETSLLELARALSRVMGSSAAPQHVEARKVNARDPPAGRHQQGDQASRLRDRDFARGRAPRPCGVVARRAHSRLRGRAMNVSVPMLPVAKPLLGEREVDAVRRVILSGWVTQGPEVAAFENEFAGLVGAAHACAVSNCTTALHLALRAVGVGPGDEVITVSHSFIATANAIRYCGGVPVFVDIEADGFNIDPALIEPAITSRTKAILCVHQLGMPCDLSRIVEIGKRHSIPVIEDAACATGSEILWNGRWEKIGKPHGDIACFSFHPRKVVTTGDGGMLTTANPEYDAKFRLWRQHGMSVTDAVRHGSKQVIFESYPEVGYNYRMTDMQAALGREQLMRLGSIVETRRRLAAEYTERLSKHSWRRKRR